MLKQQRRRDMLILQGANAQSQLHPFPTLICHGSITELMKGYWKKVVEQIGLNAASQKELICT